MTEFQWHVSQYGENYPYSFDTREEAMEYGKSEYPDSGFHAMHARQDPVQLSKYFDADDWITDISENSLEELSNPDSDGLLVDVNFTGFEEAVRQAIDDWQAKNNVVIIPYMFTSILEHVVVPPEAANDEE